MAAFGMAEILMLALLSGGINSTDLVGIIQPADYFKSRNIEPTVDRLIDLVIAEPKSPKDQVRQLVSLRHIATTADEFKKAKNYETNRLAIEEIAEGKRGKDPQGFAQEYARAVLARLDGKKPPAVKIAPLRENALSLFPVEATMAYALDIRQAPDAANDTLKELLKLMPKQAKDRMYTQLEQIGNYRVDRVAFAMVDAPERQKRKMFVHVSGKGNPDWLEQMMTNLGGGRINSKRIKAPDDTPVTLMTEGRGPAIMIIGDTDLVIAGYERFDGRHEEVVAEVLDVRAKKKANAATGKLKDRLAKIPDKAIAFAIGDLSDEMRKEMARELEIVPSKFAAHVERTAQGLDVKAEASLANAEEAGKFVKKMAELRKMGIEEIQREMKRPPRPGEPMVPFQAVINLMETIQVQGKGDKVEARAVVPNSLIQQVGQMALMFGAMSRDFDVPPPPPKCE